MHELKQQLWKASMKQQEKLKSAQESDDQDAKVEDTEVKSSECRLQYVPGVIVKVILDEPVENVKYFKVSATFRLNCITETEMKRRHRTNFS